jgi:hypothetical protein
MVGDGSGQIAIRGQIQRTRGGGARAATNWDRKSKNRKEDFRGDSSE